MFVVHTECITSASFWKLRQHYIQHSTYLNDSKSKKVTRNIVSIGLYKNTLFLKSMRSLTLLDLPQCLVSYVRCYNIHRKTVYNYHVFACLDILCPCCGCIFVQNAFLQVFLSNVTCFGCMEYLGAVKYELRYRPNIGVRSDEQNNRNRKLIWRKSEIKLKLCVLA